MPMGSGGGGGASSGAIEAGGAFVRLSADSTALNAALEQAKAKIQAFGGLFIKTGAVVGAAGAAIFAPLAGFFKQTVGAINEVGGLSRQFGIPIEEMSKLSYAFGSIGVEADEFGHILKDLAKGLSNAADGSDEIFRRLGLDAKELLDTPLDQAFLKIGKAIADVSNPLDQTRVAMELFSRHGLSILTLMRQGPEALSKKFEEASELGAVFTQEMADQALSVKKGWRQLAEAVRFTGITIGTALLPATELIATYTKAVRLGVMQIRDFAAEHKPLIQTIAVVGIGLIAAGSALAIFGKAVSLVGGGIGPLVAILKIGFGSAILLATHSFSAFMAVIGLAGPAITLVGSALAAIASPIGIAVAGAALLGAYLLTSTERGQRFVSAIKDGLSQLGDWFAMLGAKIKAGFIEAADSAIVAWGGIKAAIDKGDLGLAVQIAMTEVKLQFVTAMAFLKETWNDFRDFWILGWHTAIDAITQKIKALNDLMGGMLLKDPSKFELKGAGGATKVSLNWNGKPIASTKADWIDLKKETQWPRLMWNGRPIFGDNKPAPAAEAPPPAPETPLERLRRELEEGRRKDREDMQRVIDGIKGQRGSLIDEANAPKLGGQLKNEGLKGLGEMKAILPALNQTAKGLFDSPNFAAALGVGDTVGKRQLIAQEKAVAELGEIKDLLERSPMMKFS